MFPNFFLKGILFFSFFFQGQGGLGITLPLTRTTLTLTWRRHWPQSMDFSRMRRSPLLSLNSTPGLVHVLFLGFNAAQHTVSRLGLGNKWAHLSQKGLTLTPYTKQDHLHFSCNLYSHLEEVWGEKYRWLEWLILDL